MFPKMKKYKNQILIGLFLLFIVYVVVNREKFTLEGLTGNAPKELPLPSEMKPEDDKGKVGTYDKRFLDTREVPTGFSSESDYLLSQETVKGMQHKEGTPAEKTEQEKLKDKIAALEEELKDLKKTT